ncbi:putative methyltransferase-domain-containing protein [Cercophora scortea]|uniref:Methyltransferase-domain-containing protein n=1 Tax=Cercophora scortea TaxID=314031 RepID=A0AAE0IL77_9PEZI|nr:putative methyltransferase-domain-containing protein [Cercophora scortea]
MAQHQVRRFCQQYLQLEQALDFPDGEVLREEATQEVLYEKLFSDRGDDALLRPPPRYELRILKELVARTEAAIVDWDEHGISESLMSRLAHLLSMSMPSEVTAAQQRCHVSYHQSLLEGKDDEDEAQITVLESRNLISHAGTTGLRTWEAALHLGQYLCLHPSVVRGKRVLELGAGTGYLAMLCARYLGAEHVIVTDGSEDVIENLPDNFALNGLRGSDGISAMRLMWGPGPLGTEGVGRGGEGWIGKQKVDVVLGADITYDVDVIEALVATLQELVGLFPDVVMLIAATERNRVTLEYFQETCAKRGFAITNESFPVPPREEQEGPFYNDSMPIHLCQLRYTGVDGSKG